MPIFVGKYSLYSKKKQLTMGNANTKYTEMSDGAILAHIGRFIKHTRSNQNKTQAQLAEMAGINRWTVSQIENGEPITLSSLIQILRALDCLYVMQAFEYSDEISPIEYAKLKLEQSKKRVRNKTQRKNDKDALGW